MPMRILSLPFIYKPILAFLGVSSTVGLFASEDVIPGWSDVGPLAKVSILAALFSILSGVISYVIYSLFATIKRMQFDHKDDLEKIRNLSQQEQKDSRDALMKEIKDSRDAFGKVIDSVRESEERKNKETNIVLAALNETIRQLSAGCAATQAKLLEHKKLEDGRSQ